jgi:lipid A 4'-phosphatase
MVDEADEGRKDGRRAAAWVRAHPVRSLVVLTAAASLLLYLFPGLDLAATRLFYQPGRGFPAADVAFLVSLRAFGMAVFRLVMIAAVAALAAPFLFRGATLILPPRAALFLLSGAAFGPGLLVNGLLKGFWGRARPVQVSEFGGREAFTGPWVISDACAGNCSFVSGEASSSIFLVALALIVPAGWKAPVAAGAVVFALVMSLNRMAFGGHFLSDVVIAWLVTLLVVLVVHRAIYRPGSPFTDEAIAGVLDRAGRRAGRALVSARDRVRRFLARVR